MFFNSYWACKFSHLAQHSGWTKWIYCRWGYINKSGWVCVKTYQKRCLAVYCSNKRACNTHPQQLLERKTLSSEKVEHLTLHLTRGKITRVALSCSHCCCVCCKSRSVPGQESAWNWSLWALARLFVVLSSCASWSTGINSKEEIKSFFFFSVFFWSVILGKRNISIG